MTHVSTGGGASLELLMEIYYPQLNQWRNNMNKKSIVAGNWKMNKTPSEGNRFIVM